MSVDIWVGRKSFELASVNVLLALYSTISARLENDDPGSRFPVVMDRLLESGLSFQEAGTAIVELSAIREALALLPPDKVIWDWERPEWRPSWATTLTTGAATLEQVFMSSDGKPLLEVFIAVAQECKRRRCAGKYP